MLHSTKPVNGLYFLGLSIFSILLSACNDDGSSPATQSSSPAANSAQTSLSTTAIERQNYSPYVQQNFPAQPLWGDTHLHTSFSTDAGLIGNTLGPREAYRFARGEVVTASAGMKAKLIRPLDFLVVADHSENLGLAPMIAEHNEVLIADPWGKQVYDAVQAGQLMNAYGIWGAAMANNEDPLKNDGLTSTFWNRIVDAAEDYNQPGVFTALHGFEWTSSPEANNLHRVVVFRDDADKLRELIPYSNYDSSNPEDLWLWMNSYESNTGGQILAIPHNGNLSNGLMFDNITLSGEPLTADYVQRRARWEPLYEVTQIKGDGETHPSLSPNDEFADYYRWDKGNFGLYGKQEDMLAREYARQALIRGLALNDDFGTNPFKFGMIGSTDSHTSLATTREDNSFGKAPVAEPGMGAARYFEKITGVIPSLDGSDPSIFHYQSLASGLAAVWATENTREAIWDAMARKEVYGTTGTRMSVRLFAGWDYQEGDVYSTDFVEIGYTHGVPMGGDLNRKGNSAPRFMVQAAKDPDGANLDRVQIIKGWIDSSGEQHELIYDMACSDNRDIIDRRCDEAVGSTVIVDEARYLNTIGDVHFSSYWEDPDFNPELSAVYYVRVLEIPTPSWLAYDMQSFEADLPEDAVMEQQERAYTSPIWYTP